MAIMEAKPPNKTMKAMNTKAAHKKAKQSMKTMKAKTTTQPAPKTAMATYQYWPDNDWSIVA